MLWENGFETCLKNLTAAGLRSCSALVMYWMRGSVRVCVCVFVLNRHYTFWAVFCLAFHFDTLSGVADTNMAALLSKCPL
jgi:hypothetical protein